MESKKKQKSNFFKNNIHYLVIALVMLAIVALTVSLFVRQNALNQTLNSSENGTLQKPTDSSLVLPDNSSGGAEDNQNGESSGGENEKEPDKPTQTVISFIMPVENGVVICDYTEASLVYNKTLNVYTGHCAIDFAGEEGAEVLAVYGGKVESVSVSYLTGTTVTVDHGNGLKTVYNGIEVLEGIEQGVVLKQGDVIGFVSDNNRQEYKDGPHLHFEVYENGEKVSPYKYLTISEK